MIGGGLRTRRWFLQSSGALIVAAGTPARLVGQLPSDLPPSLARNSSLDTWIQINADGSVAISSGKCELGQGIQTAMAQIAADELDVDISRIHMRNADTSHSPDEGATTGSNSAKDSGNAIRAAAAEARQLLLENASELLQTPVSALTVEDGRIEGGDEYESVTYWELLAGGRFDAQATGSASPKSPDEYRYVGTSIERFDLPAKFFGEPSYVQDMRLPDMLHARVVRADADAVRLVDVDATSVESMPGVVGVIRDGSFLAVTAEREEQAIAAAEALRSSAQWEVVRSLPDAAELPDLLRTYPAVSTVVHETGSTDAASSELVEHAADYSRPHTSHGSIGPSAAVALWDGTSLKVWSHAQGMYPLRQALARVTGLDEDNVQCIHSEGSGCYGHNGADDAACDAAMVAMAVPNRPIRMQWMRQDEFKREPFGPAMSMRIEAATNGSGDIEHWNYEVWSPSHSTRPYYGGDTAGSLLASQEKTNPVPKFTGRNIPQPAGGADRNAVALYAFPQQRVVEHYVTEQPLRVSALRGLGAFGNVFAIESFVDELAIAHDADPFEYRLRHLSDPRARTVIEAVRSMAGSPPSFEGRLTGRGIAFAQYKNLAAYLALVVDISVEPSSGYVRAEKAYSVMEAGQIISPDGCRNQVEGGIIQAASWTLKEAVRNSHEAIVSVDWASYPILRFDEIPEIEVELIDRPEMPILGVGEAAQGPTAAAIANAVANATGARLRDLPLTPERVAAALRPAA
jgi:CO/xanthine dehydrogenase Mo-binding subunit